MESLSVEELSCPVCYEIFKTPVLLSCSHSFCKDCLQNFWSTRETQECPVCRRRSSREEPPVNLVLKNLCESFVRHRSSSGSEEMCGLHREKLKLFCLEDKQPVCVVCFTSQKHLNHTVRPIDEVVSAHKEELNTELKSLQEKHQHKEKVKQELEKTIEHIKAQAQHSERQIRQRFETLHQLLRDEEAAAVSALKQEEQQKMKKMEETLQELNTQISALTHTITHTQETMEASDAGFLKEFALSMERVRISPPDLQLGSGALIDVSRHLGNLTYRVWRKMEDIAQHTPVIPDPNTAHPLLFLSDDLTTVRNTGISQSVPDNPERFDQYNCVLGSEGLSSGKHRWDVEVKESGLWSVGVITASQPRKGCFSNTGLWCVENGYFGFGVRVIQKYKCVRVDLDYEKGTLSFSDPKTNKHLYTYRSSFTEELLPIFWCSDSLRILPSSGQ